MSTTTPLMQLLQGYLKITSDRQQLIASNVANADTPGYHTKDINFQTAMRQVRRRAMTRSSRLHRLRWKVCPSGPTATT